MAVGLLNLKTGSITSETTNNTTENKTRKRKSRRKATSKDGVELLRQAVNVRLVQDSEALADVISEKARKGDLASAKAMVELAAGKQSLPEPVKKRCGVTRAQRLAADSPWQGKKEEEGEVD